jgi:ribosomal protein S18 acetylase RimI-like enzyme
MDGWEQLPASGLQYRVSDPADDAFDHIPSDPTSCGEEEAQYFRSRAWTGVVDGRECECFEFADSNTDVVGYIAFQVVEKEHPTRRSKQSADYLFLYHLWIAPRCRGQVDDGSEPERSWARSAVALVEQLANQLECAGVYLNVRSDNEPARHLYSNLGFVEDGSYTSNATGHEMLRMRKVLL